MRRLALLIVLLLTLAVPAWGIVFDDIDDGDHPNVGSLMVAFDVPDNGGTQTIVAQLCSGTLLDNDVFLTAAHCVSNLQSFLPPGFRLGVSFADDVSALPESALIDVTETHPHPAFVANAANGLASKKVVDVGVAILDYSPIGVMPAMLPAVGLVDTLNFKTQRFTTVGYGVNREDKRRGPHSLGFDGLRRFAEQSATQANPSWLKLSMNPSTGNGGTCFGDSGGPHFLGTGLVDTYPGTIVSVTSWGDRWCRSTDWTARVDSQTAHDFITQYTTNGT